MDLKFTKVIVQHSTNQKSKNGGRAKNIEKVSQGLKSTSRGLYCEQKVIEYLSSRKHIFLKQRLKTPFAEIDLLFENLLGQLEIVEVKSLSQDFLMSSRIGQRQKNRLYNARLYMQEKYQKEVLLYWAFVDSHGKVLLLECD